MDAAHGGHSARRALAHVCCVAIAFHLSYAFGHQAYELSLDHQPTTGLDRVFNDYLVNAYKQWMDGEDSFDHLLQDVKQSFGAVLARILMWQG